MYIQAIYVHWCWKVTLDVAGYNSGHEVSSAFTVKLLNIYKSCIIFFASGSAKLECLCLQTVIDIFA